MANFISSKPSEKELRDFIGNKVVLPAGVTPYQNEWEVKGFHGNTIHVENTGETVAHMERSFDVDGWRFAPSVVPGPSMEPVPMVIFAPHQHIREREKNPKYDGATSWVNLGIEALVEIGDYTREEVEDGYRRRRNKRRKLPPRDIHQFCRATLMYFRMDADVKSVIRLHNTLQKAVTQFFQSVNLMQRLIREKNIRVMDGLAAGGAQLSIREAGTDDPWTPVETGQGLYVGG